jgi:polysaccharide transporter, PST family
MIARYFTKMVVIQLFNVITPFILMHLLLKNEGVKLFAELELLIALSFFGSLITEFSFSLVCPILNNSEKYSKRRLDYLNTNIMLLRSILFVVASLIIFVLINFLNITIVQNWYLIFILIMVSVVDVGWVYLVKDVYHKYFLHNIFLKNVLIISLIYYHKDELNKYYLIDFTMVKIFVNLIIYKMSQVKFKKILVSFSYIKLIFNTGFQIAITEFIKGAYSYLDVYFSAVLLTSQELPIYLIIRKLVKGASGLVANLPKIALRYSAFNKQTFYEMKMLYVIIIIIFFLIFNFFSKYVYTFLNVISYNQIKLYSSIFSFMIIMGPLQNLFLQSVILRSEKKIIYIQSYLLGLLFFLISIFGLEYFSLMSILSFILIRVLLDGVIGSYSYLRYKV